MTTREPFESRWNLSEIRAEIGRVSPEQAVQLIEAVNLGPPSFPEKLANTRGKSPPEQLAILLNYAAFNIRSNESLQSAYTREEVAERANKASHLANELHETLFEKGRLATDFEGALYGIVSEEIDSRDAYETYRTALLGFQRLATWLAIDAEKKKADATVRRSPTKRPGPKKDQAAHRLVYELGQIYQLAWDREPGLSRDPDTSKLRGPFFRFVSESLPLVAGETRSDEAVAALIKANT